MNLVKFDEKLKTKLKYYLVPLQETKMKRQAIVLIK